MATVGAAFPKYVTKGKAGPFKSYKSPRLLIGNLTSIMTNLNNHSTQHMLAQPYQPIPGERMFKKVLGRGKADVPLYFADTTRLKKRR
jgi:glutathione synthase/RimK-type ligase-like ATP-grasp enzyme